MATRTEPSAWMAGLLQTTDSFYPTGSYAHSFGLEGLAQEGSVRDLPSLKAFLLEHALPSLGHTDLPIASLAWEAAGKSPDWEQLKRLCELGLAVRGSREPRSASEAIGRQRIELSARLHGGFAEIYRDQARWETPACVAAAIEGRVLEAPKEAVLAAIVYSSCSGLVAAAMKLLRLGQNAGQSALAEALIAGGSVIQEALALPYEQIGAFNPWWDIASSRHETADFRLFIS